MQSLFKNFTLIMAAAMVITTTLPAQAHDDGAKYLLRFLGIMEDIAREQSQHQHQRNQHRYYGYPHLTVSNSRLYVQLSADKKVKVRQTEEGYFYVRMYDLKDPLLCPAIGGHAGWYDKTSQYECYFQPNDLGWW